jgi:MFS family permease
MGVGNTVLPLYVLSLGGIPGDWGTMFALFAIAIGVGEVAAGMLSDRYGIRLGWIGGVEDAGVAVGAGLSGLLLALSGRPIAFATLGLVLLAGAAICTFSLRELEWVSGASGY